MCVWGGVNHSLGGDLVGDAQEGGQQQPNLGVVKRAVCVGEELLRLGSREPLCVRGWVCCVCVCVCVRARARVCVRVVVLPQPIPVVLAFKVERRRGGGL